MLHERPSSQQALRVSPLGGGRPSLIAQVCSAGMSGFVIGLVFPRVESWHLFRGAWYMSVRRGSRVGRVARVGLMSGAVVTAIVMSGVLPAAAAVSTTSVVSAAPDGANADNESYDPSVSADGRYVAFASSATNLVALDGNGARDIFVRDLTDGTTVRVSVDSAEVEANNSSYRPSISADGRYVAFESSASNLVAVDGNDERDIFVRDLTGGTTVRVSVDSAEVEANKSSNIASISADGRFVAFESSADNLVAG
ncbi:MAG: hypothetical protein F2700_08850, partial [Actinobacteria bacterium]|nr:hypothetical protein [Actinomycetota bacterium]